MKSHLLSLLLTPALLLGACTADPPVAVQPPPKAEPQTPGTLALSTPALGLDRPAAELIFSGVVKGGLSEDGSAPAPSTPRSFTLSNPGPGSTTVTGLTLSGADAGAFSWTPPTLPFTLGGGQSRSFSLTLAPAAGRVGELHASLQVSAAAGPGVRLDLYGLSAKGEQGSNEPTLQSIAATLGYSVNVGTADLILGTSSQLQGDEVSAGLFRKSGTGPVRLLPVARYSPAGPAPYGYFTLSGDQPQQRELASTGESQDQTLYPALSGSISFDPGDQNFGIYADKNSYATDPDFTLDRLNKGPISHPFRVYPLKDRAGQPTPGYLLALESNKNGDYQDAVFVLTGAVAVSQP